METFQISGVWKIGDQETETPEKQTRDYFEEFHTVILSTAEQKCKGITEGHEVLDLGAGDASLNHQYLSVMIMTRNSYPFAKVGKFP